MDWGKYSPLFFKSEFDCKHTGENEMREDFMDALLALRLDYGKPMTITSGYRHPTHPVEAKKPHSQGEHTQGNCCDVACTDSRSRYQLIKLALKHGFHRIGIHPRFIHLGRGGEGLPQDVIWEY